MTSENTQLTVMESFQQKIKDRIRKDMGDLLPDEALKEMVNKCIHEAFFEDIKEEGSGYDYRIYTRPPWLVSHIKELMEGRVKVATEEWLSENSDFIEKQIDKVLKEGITRAVLSTLDLRLYNVTDDIVRQSMQRAGINIQ